MAKGLVSEKIAKLRILGGLVGIIAALIGLWVFLKKMRGQERILEMANAVKNGSGVLHPVDMIRDATGAWVVK